VTGQNHQRDTGNLSDQLDRRAQIHAIVQQPQKNERRQPDDETGETAGPLLEQECRNGNCHEQRGAHHRHAPLMVLSRRWSVDKTDADRDLLHNQDQDEGKQEAVRAVQR
jgi:hypothetical protein